MDNLIKAVQEVWPAVAGAALAAVRAPNQDWQHRVIGFLVGFFIALFGTVPLLDFFHMKSEIYGGGFGFALGFFGMTVADAITGTDWASIIKDRFSK